MSRADLRRRVAALAEAIKPASNSLEARLERLSPAERNAYSEHRDRIAAWIKRNPDQNLYEATLAGEAPTMPRTLSEKLTGPTPIITPDMREDQAAETYRRYALEN